MGSAQGSDQLKTLEVIVGVVVALMAIVAGVVLAGTVAGSGSIPRVAAEVCVASDGDRPPFLTPEGERTGSLGPADGTRWHVEAVQVCNPDPDGVTRTLGAGGLLVRLGGPLLFFCLLWRLVRRARREGVFADRIPGRLRMLGAVLLVWAALDFVVTGFVDAALLARMAPDDSAVFFTADVPWTLVLVGLALLALAEVMGEAVDMRHDVEATI